MKVFSKNLTSLFQVFAMSLVDCVHLNESGSKKAMENQVWMNDCGWRIDVMSIIHQSSNTKPSLPCTIFSKPPLQNAFSGLSVCVLHCKQRVSESFVCLVVWLSKKQKTNSEGQAWWVSCSSEAFLQVQSTLLAECFQLCSHHTSMSVLVVSNVYPWKITHRGCWVLWVLCLLSDQQEPCTVQLLQHLLSCFLWARCQTWAHETRMCWTMKQSKWYLQCQGSSMWCSPSTSHSMPSHLPVPLCCLWHDIKLWKSFLPLCLIMVFHKHTPKSQRCQCRVDFQRFTQCLCPFISNVVPCCVHWKPMSEIVIRNTLKMNAHSKCKTLWLCGSSEGPCSMPSHHHHQCCCLLNGVWDVCWNEHDWWCHMESNPQDEESSNWCLSQVLVQDIWLLLHWCCWLLWTDFQSHQAHNLWWFFRKEEGKTNIEESRIQLGWGCVGEDNKAVSVLLVTHSVWHHHHSFLLSGPMTFVERILVLPWAKVHLDFLSLLQNQSSLSGSVRWLLVGLSTQS